MEELTYAEKLKQNLLDKEKDNEEEEDIVTSEEPTTERKAIDTDEFVKAAMAVREKRMVRQEDMGYVPDWGDTLGESFRPPEENLKPMGQGLALSALAGVSDSFGLNPDYFSTSPYQELGAQSVGEKLTQGAAMMGGFMLQYFAVAGGIGAGINAMSYTKNLPAVYQMMLREVGADIVIQGGTTAADIYARGDTTDEALKNAIPSVMALFGVNTIMLGSKTGGKWTEVFDQVTKSSANAAKGASNIAEVLPKLLSDEGISTSVFKLDRNQSTKLFGTKGANTYDRSITQGYTPAESVAITGTEQVSNLGKRFEKEVYQTKEFKEVQAVTHTDPKEFQRSYVRQRNSVRQEVRKMADDTLMPEDIRYLDSELKKRVDELEFVDGSGLLMSVRDTVVQSAQYNVDKSVTGISATRLAVRNLKRKAWQQIDKRLDTHVVPPTANAGKVDEIIDYLSKVDSRLQVGIKDEHWLKYMDDGEFDTLIKKMEKLEQNRLGFWQNPKTKKEIDQINTTFKGLVNDAIPKQFTAKIMDTEAWKLLTTKDGFDVMLGLRQADTADWKSIQALARDAGDYVQSEMFTRYNGLFKDKVARQGAPARRELEKFFDSVKTNDTTTHMDTNLRLVGYDRNKEFDLNRIAVTLSNSIEEEMNEVITNPQLLQQLGLDPQISAQIDELVLQRTQIPADATTIAKIDEQLFTTRQQVTRGILQDPTMRAELLANTTNPRLRSVLAFHATLLEKQGVEDLFTYQGKMFRERGDDVTELINLEGATDEALKTRATAQAANDEAIKPPSKGDESVLVNEAGVTSGQMIENAKVGTEGGFFNFLSKYFQAPITRAENMKNLFRMGSNEHKAIEQLVEAMKGMARGRNSYMTILKENNHKIRTMFESWDKLPETTRITLYNTIDVIDKHVNKSWDRVKVNKESKRIELEQWITNHLAKQSPEVKEQYNAIRSVLDDQLNYVNGKIKEFNDMHPDNAIKEIERRPGYIPYIYNGKWNVTMTLANKNKASILIQDNAQLTTHIENLVKDKWLVKDADGHVVVTSMTVEPRWHMDFEDFNAADSLLKDAETWELDTTELQKLLSPNIDKQGKFSGDFVNDVLFAAANKRNLSATALKESLQSSIYTSSRLGIRFGEMIAPIAGLKKSQISLKQLGLYELADEANWYARNVTGVTRTGENQFDKAIQTIMGSLLDNPKLAPALEAIGFSRSSRPTRALAQMLTSWGRLLTIGFNPASALLQYGIVGTNILPVYKSHVLGAWGDVMKYTKKGTREYKLARTYGVQTSAADGTTHGNFRDYFHGSAGGAETYGDIGDAVSSARAGKARHINKAVNDYGMLMFNGSETHIRLVSLEAGIRDGTARMKRIISGKAPTKKITSGVNEGLTVYKSPQDQLLADIARQGGWDNVKDMDSIVDKYSGDMMLDLNFDFDVSGLSRVASHPIAKPFMQFKTYFTQEIEFLLGLKVPLSPAERGAVWGMFGAIGGLYAMPGVKDSMVLADWIVGNDIDLQQWAHDNLPDTIKYGVVPGISFGSMIELGGVNSITNIFESVLAGKIGNASYNYSTGRSGLLETIATTPTMGRRAKNLYDYIEHGGIPRGSELGNKGGLGTGLLNIIGIQTKYNENINAQRRLDRGAAGLKRKTNAQFTNALWKSSNKAKTINEWIKKKKISKDDAKRISENMSAGR